MSRSTEKAGDAGRRERVRLNDLRFEAFPDSRCRASVALGWSGPSTFEGHAEGTDTQQGRLQAGALAAIRALQGAAGDRFLLELRGVKAIRAFDAWVVIVSVQGRGGERTHALLGSTAAPRGDLVHGAVLAVLDATNRILEPHLERTDA